MLNRKIWITLTVIITLFLSCGKKANVGEYIISDEKIKIKIAEVHVEDIEQLFEYTAVVRAEAINNIAPTLPGRIDEILVEVGDIVTKGQKLVQMDATQLRQAKTQLDFLEANFSRIDELHKVGGISKADRDAQKTSLDVAHNSYQNLLENTQLLAPINGVVTMRNYDSGDLYTGSPILQIQQIKPVKLLVNISESQYNDVRIGTPVKIKVDLFENDEFPGKVSLIYPTLDPLTHTFTVEITIPNANGKIRPGMYARAIFNLGIKKNVVIPDVAVVKQHGSGDRFAYVYDDNKVSYIKIELGRRFESSYEILSGLKDGDKVATTSLSKLNDGVEVIVVE